MISDDAAARTFLLPLHTLTSDRRRPLLGWPAIGIVSMMLGAALFQPLGQIGPLVVGGITVEPIDMGLFCVCAVMLLESLIRTEWKPLPRPVWPMVTLILVLAWPIVVGFYAGNAFQSVMFQGRVAAYYVLFFAYWQLIPTKRIAANLLHTMVGIAVIAAAYGLLTHILGWQWQAGWSSVPTSQGNISRGYGWWSAMPWYVWGAIICAAYSWLSSASTGRRVVMACISGLLVVSTLSTFIRGDLVGIVLGFCFVAFVGLRPSATWRRAVKRLWVGLPVIALVVILGVGLAYSANKAYVSVVIERAMSIVGASQSAPSTAQVTAEIRIHAMSGGLRSAVNAPLGIGYGYPPGREADLADVNYLAGHNALAWAGYFYGLVGLGVLVLCFIGISLHFRRIVASEHEYGWAATAAVAILVAILGQSVGAAYFFGSPEVYVLVPIFLAMVWMFGSATGGTATGADGQ